jgi:hypothetical protein
MSYVIANKETLRRPVDKTYNSRAWAQKACDKINAKYTLGNYAVMTWEEYVEADTLVPSVNLMTGKTIWVAKSAKGGCCDPASESYWSM